MYQFFSFFPCVLRFIASVIDAIYGVDIRNMLLTTDEEGIQQIVSYANQAMIEACSQAQSELMIELILVQSKES